ncbi:hypothetical protein RO3G_05474 [Rhizopus delemar RA 99-880]|uniref:Uncharacterized protein n=1 Tax=Rhizopus delemar (strain RA 99-880 / ATCC MYA-4621 / FGSC 9543 / NRRL 43880) TaxID=246409 RepID=I1BX39_RHIO9|nr:hypothetical protein RO3G_05474 [Rhizopus delemar RA 99-880]|eukprot:EIE80769.1 hypothetical protein RO3G_05474 [Rhizopus delemar RA 99-880]
MVLPSQTHHTSSSAALAVASAFKQRHSQNGLQTLLDTIQRLTQELQQARAEINSLCSQTDKFQQQLLQQTQTTDPFPSLNQQTSLPKPISYDPNE